MGATAAVSSVTICRDGGQGATVTRWQWCHSPMVCGPLRWMRATACVKVDGWRPQPVLRWMGGGHSLC